MATKSDKVRRGKISDAAALDKAQKDSIAARLKAKEEADNADKVATAAEVKRLAAAEAKLRKNKTRHEGNTTIDMLITTPDGQAHKRSMLVNNPRGCIHPTNLCNPDYIVEVIKKELTARFGRAHIK